MHINAEQAFLKNKEFSDVCIVNAANQMTMHVAETCPQGRSYNVRLFDGLGLWCSCLRVYVTNIY